MKKSILFYIVILSYCLFSCNDEVTVPITIYESVDQTNGWVTATIEGHDFEAGGEVVLISEEDSIDRFAVHFRTQAPEGYLREMYNLRSIPYKVGFYEIVHTDNVREGFASARFYTLIDDGDVRGSRYGVDESKTNFIEVTEVNEVEELIKGNFSVHFKLEEDEEPPSTHPKKFSLKNGVFEMKIR